MLSWAVLYTKYNIWVCAHCSAGEPSLELNIIIVIVVFLLLLLFCWLHSMCMCMCACVCSIRYVCIWSHFLCILLPFSSGSGCMYLFRWMCVRVCVRVCLLLFWYEYAPGPFHYYSLHLSVCIDIFSLHQITELLLLLLLMLLLYKWCAIICFFHSLHVLLARPFHSVERSRFSIL